MGFAFRTIFAFALIAGAVWGTFFVELGGKNLASHIQDIWRSPVVQKKVDLVEHQVKQEIGKRLAQSAPSVSKPTGGQTHEEFSAEDREALRKLLEAQKP